MNKNIATYLALVFCTIFWGGAFVAAKVVLQELSPLVAASLRFIMATCVLVPVLFYAEGKKALITLKELPLLIGAGLTGIFLYNICFFKGLQLTSAINGSLLVASGPTITALLAYLLVKEPLKSNQILGLFISFLGVIIIIAKGSLTVLTTMAFNRGDIYIFTGVIAWSLYTIIGKVATKKRSPLLTTTYAIAFGGVFLTFLAWPEISWQGISNISFLSWSLLFFMAVFASAIGFILWYKGVSKIGANRASSFQNVVPLTSALLSILFLGEKLHGYHGIGALGILLGVYIANSQEALPGVMTRFLALGSEK